MIGSFLDWISHFNLIYVLGAVLVLVILAKWEEQQLGTRLHQERLEQIAEESLALQQNAVGYWERD